MIDSIVTICFLGAMMFGMLKFMLRDIHNDLTELKAGQKRLEERMDKSDVRIDHLYEMFISVQKETKDMFIDLLKDRK